MANETNAPLPFRSSKRAFVCELLAPATYNCLNALEEMVKHVKLPLVVSVPVKRSPPPMRIAPENAVGLKTYWREEDES
jgi:hypothetical protein